MTKAWEIKALVDRFKSRGLDIAEDAAKLIIEETFGWTEESIVLSETKLDDIGLVGLPLLKKMALDAADKIDGQVG